MSKLKLNKITISNLDPEESSSVIGGEASSGGICVSLSILSIISVITSSKCPNPVDDLTMRPGHQDSCGLCTELPDEEEEEVCE